ncbi:MAG: PhoH family protein [Gammaproteobacteria bacterium]
MVTDSKRRLFVLDTNVLMHDPTAMFRFHEHDVYLPMVVLEELDAAKKGISEVARNARQVSRMLDDLIGPADRGQIERGLALPQPNHTTALSSPRGRLFLQTHTLPQDLPMPVPSTQADHFILAAAIELQKMHAQRTVVLVSKDINLRIKARMLGVHAEEYHSDQVIDDVDLLYTGALDLPADFWDQHGKEISCWQENGRTRYTVRGSLAGQCFPNQFVCHQNHGNLEAIVRRIEGQEATIEQVIDYRVARNAVWGITARNREQNFALNLLLDPSVDFVTLLGTAGTGKTLLALAAGLAQTMETQGYREIVMTRVTVPVGEDIGFLPGTEEEKMTPWMGALMDNLEVLTHTESGGEWGRAATHDLIQKRIKIRSLNFMRGRTFLNRYVIIDEAQNLTPKQMKTLITRAGPGTKMVCLGNIGQIDTPYLSETTSGLTYVVDRFKAWPHSGHVILVRGERSRLADFAAEAL